MPREQFTRQALRSMTENRLQFLAQQFEGACDWGAYSKDELVERIYNSPENFREEESRP